MNRTTIFEAARTTRVKPNLREGFAYRSSEDHQRIASKVARVLGRRFGVKCNAGHSPYHFERNGQVFISYFAPSSSDELSFRINFLMSSDRPSTRIHSFDVYLELESLEEPDFTVLITDPQASIVKIINNMEDLTKAATSTLRAEERGIDSDGLRDSLADEGVEFREARQIARETRRIQEASKKATVIDFLKVEGGGYPDFVRWATSKGLPTPSQAYFKNVKQQYEGGAGVGPSDGTRASSAGYTIAEPTAEKPLWDEEDEEVFNDIKANEAIEKFEELELILRKMAHGDPNFNALFIYGSPGVGKTYRLHKVFEEEQSALEQNGLKVVTKTGAIGGFTGLLTVLYEHRDGYILVLDDNDQILKNQTGANILKGAMNTKLEDRHVTYSVADKSAFVKRKEEEPDPDDEEVFEESIHVYQKDGQTLFERALRPHRVHEADEMSAYEDEDPTDFYFRSRIVFVSNMLEVPAAIDDRCYSVDMVFDFEQIMEMIRNVMSHIDIPGVPDEMRMDVYEFLKKNQFAIEYKLGQQVTMTFRKFRSACIAWEAAISGGLGEVKAKRLAYRQLRGAK